MGKATSVYLSDEAVKKVTAAAKKQKRSLSYIINQMLLTLKAK